MGNEPSHLVLHARSTSSFSRQLPRLYIGNSYEHTSKTQALVRLTLQSSIVEDQLHVVPIITGDGFSPVLWSLNFYHPQVSCQRAGTTQRNKTLELLSRFSRGHTPRRAACRRGLLRGLTSGQKKAAMGNIWWKTLISPQYTLVNFWEMNKESL